MIKTDARRGVSPISAKKKSTAKTKDEDLQISGMGKYGQHARMVGASAPPRPVYLIPPFNKEDDISNKLTSSSGKKSLVVKKPGDKLDTFIASKVPKTKAGPTNGVILIDKNDVLESVGFQSSAGRSDGRVKTNQDSFIVDTVFQGNPGRALIGIFDGHGLQGHKVSNFLIHNIQEVLQLSYSQMAPADLAKSFTDACHNLNVMLKKASFIETKLSGSTGVMVLVEPGRVTCSNVGDSRAILFSPLGNNFTAYPLSTDQKPSDPQERARIISHGGKVHPSRRSFFSLVPSGKFLGPPRVWTKNGDIPGLMMSRSFGDEVGHSCGIICTPGSPN